MRVTTGSVVLILLGLSAAFPGHAADRELWSIGEFDKSYMEFACARDYGSYTARFPNDVTYRIGTSKPGTDWSFIHPGPTDYWAGSREHPFKIEFALPGGTTDPLRLTIGLVDVQGQVPSGMRISVNGAEGSLPLANGNGDATLYDPARGAPRTVSCLLPASLFRAGGNEITIVSTGSWFLYDAVSLSAVPAADVRWRVRSISLEPTALFKKDRASGALRQVVLVRADIEGPNEGLRLTATVNNRAVAQINVPKGPLFGVLETELPVPPVTRETPLTVTAKLRDTSAQAQTTLCPERHWKVFVAASTHTDIGYTDLQANVAKRHCENTDRVIELCGKYPAFGWNLEVAWQADQYRRHRSREQAEKLWQLAREGRIGVHAGYVNELTGLCSFEELNRWLYFAHSLKRDHGVPFESALNTDVPTEVWSLPSILAAAGIRYFAAGIDNYRAPTFTKLETGDPYWWEGPDGSRVLTYFAPGYAQAGGPLHSIQDLRRWLVSAIKSRASSPYDALYMYGAIGDNGQNDPAMAGTAQKWANEYEYPKIIMGPSAEYFKYMESAYGARIPVVRGDGGVYWEDGAASSAQETTLNRRAHETASAADALLAFTARLKTGRQPTAMQKALWRDMLLYDEHTWGAYCSTSAPDSPFSRSQWEVKSGFAKSADREGAQLLAKGMQRLASQIRRSGPSVVVFNATSWPREGEVISAALPSGMVPADPATGKALPTVSDPDNAGARVLFRVPSVPAWGYAALPLITGTPAAVQMTEMSGSPTLENEAFRLALDPASGGITSLQDKTAGRELVDPSAPQRLNEYLYVSGGDGSNIVDLGANRVAQLTIHTPESVRVVRQALPGLGERLIVRSRAEKTPAIEQQYTLWIGSRRVDIRNRLTRTAVRAMEAAYFAFPFAARRPDMRIEIPNGVLRPDIDQLPGACKDWYCLQHWMTVGDGERRIVWASPDAPLLCIGDINRGLWRQKLEVADGRVYSYIMNNYWNTNYKADQSGDFEFRYAVSAGAGLDDTAAARMGWQTAMPLTAQIITGPQCGSLPGVGHSFCSVSPGSVIVTAIKPEERGGGVVVRLFSLAPKPVTATIRLGIPGLRSATLSNLVEEPICELSMSDGVVEVPVRPMSPTTVVVR
jgi:hypothetical protein